MSSLLELSALDSETIGDLVADGARKRDTLIDGARPAATLAGTTVANMFFEPSTRTQLSFDLAAQRLGAYVLNFNEIGSSTSKGESLRDTVETVAAVGADVIVVRHRTEGAPSQVADWCGRYVINAGEGQIAHPTQALLDMVTMVRRFGSLSGLRVGIVGDLAHSRVAASLCRALPRFGVDLVQIAPRVFQIREFDLVTEEQFDPVIPTLDVVYMLRVQTERGAVIDQEYIDAYQLHRARLDKLPPASAVMHPGPVNRDVEIESSILDDERSLVLEQVANGVPTRMSVLEWVTSG